MSNSGHLDYSELPNILPSDVKGGYFAKGTEKSKILGSWLGKEVENLGDHGSPEVQDLVDEQTLSFFELLIQTQDRTSLCRARSKIIW